MKRIYLLLGLIAAAIALLIYASGRTMPSPDNGRKQVVASFFPLYYFAKAIGGDHADVRDFIPAGVEPHDYEPTPQDIARLEDSDLVILNGGGFEPWAESLGDILKGTSEIVRTSEGLATREIQGPEGAVRDPHVWLAPPLAKQQASKILEAFIKIDPGNSSFYESNAASLQRKIEQLDQEFKSGLRDCRQKSIVTSHAAFGYLAQAYGLEQVPISGLSPEEEPSSQDLARIVELARKEKVDYVFFEALGSRNLAETVAREIGAQTLPLDPIESGTDYFSQMRQNLTNLQLALGCQK